MEQTPPSQTQDEREIVRRWRLQQLERAGYNRYDAFVLSGDPAIDLHRAEDLLACGCPETVALRILL